MAKQNFYDFTSVIAEEMEALLIKLKSLISAKKITDNLPENLKGEIDEINEKLDKAEGIQDIFSSGIDGGEYEHLHIYGDWMKLDDDNCVRTCIYGDQEKKNHTWNYDTQTPTHMEIGYEQQTCIDCGHVIYREIPKIPVHTYDIYTSLDEIQHEKRCECGDSRIEGHKWDEGVVTVEPTTTSTGVMTYACNVCGESKTEEIPKIITLETLDVGSKVYLNVDGVPKKFIVVHQGLPSDDYDSSCDGTWLLMEDIYKKRSWARSGVSSFIASDVSAYLNNIFLYNLDNEIQRVIKHVIIPDAVSGQIATTIFLLSGYEVGWTISNFMELAKDGSCLDYFADMLVSDNGRVAYDNGVAYDWWLRSRDRMSQSFALCVDGAGVGQTVKQTIVLGIRPALILPRDLAVSDEDGIYNIIV